MEEQAVESGHSGSSATLSPAKKRGRKKLIKDISEKLYYVEYPAIYFTKEDNTYLKVNRIPKLGIPVLKIWIKRYVLEGQGTDDDFGISLENKQVVAWFKTSIHAARCEELFDQIRYGGFPKRQYWVF